ncbi:MAG TPA: Zn-binding domain-containing protein [Thermoanaerobaculia bacterium]|nr:Zn-binding domain-containing protein [Thermoanaerobaculia bacterium]
MKALLPLLLTAAALAAVAADFAARARRPGGDRGDFWARLAGRTALGLGVPLFVSQLMENLFPQAWVDGWHLLFDRTGAFGRDGVHAYPWALLLPFALWVGLLGWGLIEAPGGREAGRWLAGAVRAEGSRAWVLLCAAPFATILTATYDRLGGGDAAYPAAVWGTLAVLTVALAGVAASAGRPASSPGTAPDPVTAATPGPPPWPQALAAQGIDLRPLATWPPSAPGRAPKGAAGELAERLRRRGAGPVAPELVEAVHALLAPATAAGDAGLTRLVFAPDDCGEVEAVVLLAELLDRRFHTATLVVAGESDGGVSALAARLAREVRGSGRVVILGAIADSADSAGSGDVAAGLPADVLLAVTDAQELSDRLLARLRDPAAARRLGLVVWWHLEGYTGVLAANLWAVSRRLHRLLAAQGRHDVRTLALVRRAPHGGAQLASFVRRLLPRFSNAAEVHVEPRFTRPLHLHLLVSHRGHFLRGGTVPPRLRHPALVAAKVSVEAGWPTALEPPDDVAGIEASAFLQLPAQAEGGPAPLGDLLAAGSAQAGARIREVRSSEVLALPDVLGQGGRSAPAGLPHHVGLIAPANPYAAYLLDHFASAAGFPASRRLVSTEVHPALVRRHLLFALSELPDTRSGLLKDFLWEEEVIRDTLDGIAAEGKLTRREVRYLERGELRRDHEYTSQRPPSGEPHPLDTVGAELVAVREPAAGRDAAQGVRMRVDPERLTIQAYPYRVFLCQGRRFRIREWESVAAAVATGWLACEPEEVYAATWRLRRSQVYAIEPSGRPVGIGRAGRLLTRVAVDLTYEEWVSGALRQTRDLTSGQMPEPETQRLARPIHQSFATRGLVLRFPQPEDEVALASLCQALRHVLPVHLGVEEDALELVPLGGEEVDGIPTFGLAIVDLYPGGIGLVDAVGDDSAFLLEVLGWTRDWLSACPCQSPAGCPRCLRSPAALAANSDQPPSRGAALDLLRPIV